MSETREEGRKYFPKTNVNTYMSYKKKQDMLKLCSVCQENMCMGIRCRQCHFLSQTVMSPPVQSSTVVEGKEPETVVGGDGASKGSNSS